MKNKRHLWRKSTISMGKLLYTLCGIMRRRWVEADVVEKKTTDYCLSCLRISQVSKK